MKRIDYSVVFRSVLLPFAVFVLLGSMIVIMPCDVIAAGPAAPTYTVAPAGTGMVALHLTNGNITYCSGSQLSIINGVVHNGICLKIGSIPTTSIPNTQIVSPPGANVAIFMNVATGVAVECSLTTQNGLPSGSCVNQGILP